MAIDDASADERAAGPAMMEIFPDQSTARPEVQPPHARAQKRTGV